uniref:Trehalase n=1 Tax=Panagrolaimus superbus TaxID=310955 RepID=A0A914Z0N7_9BILA
MTRLKNFLGFFGCIFLLSTLIKCEDDIYMCDSKNSKNWQIYCSGRILEAYNFHQITNDSKEYVDKPLIYSPEETIQNFTKLFGNLSAAEINREKFAYFINQSFQEAGHELKKCDPDGFIEYPPKLSAIKDQEMKEFAFSLHKIWKELCKEMDEKVLKNPEKFSLLPLKHKFIAPGGRFREPYYWDAYWIIKGLMASELYDAAKQMIYNFADYVNTYGFIPNGGRVYYLQRYAMYI